MTDPIPVIDLFAGPGGLGEGFACVGRADGRAFRIALSIEKDERAHQTLELRAFFRQFPRGHAPEAYYSYLRGEILRDVLFESFPVESERAQHEAWRATLGEDSQRAVHKRIREALGTAVQWVLVGGPPCQAYSLVGRSRMAKVPRSVFESDNRHRLYNEYLRILAEHGPPVFVMENVKGLLSSRLDGGKVFDRIVGDLEAPRAALGRGRGHRYHLFELASPRPGKPAQKSTPKATGFVVRSEEHGIPQARHRVILVGVRDDLFGCGAIPATLSTATHRVKVEDVIGDLPRLRSGLSKETDSASEWNRAIRRGVRSWHRTKEFKTPELREVLRRAEVAVQGLDAQLLARGTPFVHTRRRPRYKSEWYSDPRLRGICNHETRGHIESDLHRYLFASCFADVHGRSPTLADFPASLLPNHRNVQDALGGNLFSDRFRVQLRGRPSTTITSHVSKDGHYFIHYDPAQCRSLTVREAARLQTFPDNYFFEGSRTEQYVQVGNAVPPFLARQIAEVVLNVLSSPQSEQLVSRGRTAVR